MQEKLLVLFILLLPLVFAFLPEAGASPADLTRYLREERAALAMGAFEEERSAIEQVLEFRPWRGDLWQRLGRLYMDGGDTQSALRAFENAQDLDQLDAQGHVWLADMLTTNGYGDAARHVLRSIETRDPFILLQAATLLESMGEQSSMLDLLIIAHKVEPQNSEVNYRLGIHLMAPDPGNALAYLELARAVPARGAAAAYLIQVIQDYGDLAGSVEWFLYAGQALAQAGEWHAALTSFNAAVKAMPQNATAWALLGESQQQLDMDGWQSLEKALALDADAELVNGMLGLYHRRQGNLELSLDHLQKAHRTNPQAVVWLIESGKTLAGMGELEKGLQAFEQAIAIDENDVDSWQALAEFCILHNYQVESTGLHAARQALALDPENPVMMDLLGTAYLQLGELDNAERFFLQALERDPEQAAILIHLGQLNLYRHEDEIAHEYLRRAVVSARDERLRDMATRLLKENGAQ